jgi:hypothetical protein
LVSIFAESYLSMTVLKKEKASQVRGRGRLARVSPR